MANRFLLLACLIFAASTTMSGCVPLGSTWPPMREAPPVASGTDVRAHAAERVLWALAEWQNSRGIALTSNVKRIVMDEYLSSRQRCATEAAAAIDNVNFYVFQYLDHAREEKVAYKPEIICHPMKQSYENKSNQFGHLQIISDQETFISIDSESFDKTFKQFLLEPGNHLISVNLDNLKLCSPTVTIHRGESTKISCTILSN